MTKFVVSILVFVAFVFSSVSISMPSQAVKTDKQATTEQAKQKNDFLVNTFAPNMVHNELPMVMPY